jgi:hypothetical protein
MGPLHSGKHLKTKDFMRFHANTFAPGYLEKALASDSVRTIIKMGKYPGDPKCQRAKAAFSFAIATRQ